jgi:hypothetical protein
MSENRMRNQTFSISDDTVKLINHIYVLRIIDGKRTTKGALVAEAFALLAEHEEKGGAEIKK